MAGSKSNNENAISGFHSQDPAESSGPSLMDLAQSLVRDGPGDSEFEARLQRVLADIRSVQGPQRMPVMSGVSQEQAMHARGQELPNATESPRKAGISGTRSTPESGRKDLSTDRARHGPITNGDITSSLARISDGLVDTQEGHFEPIGPRDGSSWPKPIQGRPFRHCLQCQRARKNCIMNKPRCTRCQLHGFSCDWLSEAEVARLEAERTETHTATAMAKRRRLASLAQKIAKQEATALSSAQIQHTGGLVDTFTHHDRLPNGPFGGQDSSGVERTHGNLRSSARLEEKRRQGAKGSVVQEHSHRNPEMGRWLRLQHKASGWLAVQASRSWQTESLGDSASQAKSSR